MATTKNSAQRRPKLTHLDQRGRVKMVDVGAKNVTRREAIARGAVSMSAGAAQAIRRTHLRKGDALATARLAGIMAAKRTHELIPLCHQISLDVVEVELMFRSMRPVLEIQARVATSARTGVEMEALVAVSAAALTIYDMAKALDRQMTIGPIRLVEKRGGRSGVFIRAGERQLRAT
ncbi:MAG: cyclic pyranopterin monophosphate synthase MoaC [Candidatus Binataceae bacterium]